MCVLIGKSEHDLLEDTRAHLIEALLTSTTAQLMHEQYRPRCWTAVPKSPDHEIQVIMTCKYYEINHSTCIKLNLNAFYNTNLQNSTGCIRQNHWTMKYRSH